MTSFSDAFRTWRRGLKSRLPYVRRREHRVLQRIHAELIEAVDGQATPAARARLHVVKPLAQYMTGEVCLFVTFADQPELKPHVTRHIEQLLDVGMHVVLIANTDLPAASFRSSPSCSTGWTACSCARTRIRFRRVGACAVAVRRPRALDSPAARQRQHRRPVVAPAFDRMIVRIRQSDADVIGLTESLAPHRHLQSYFLVFNASALQSAAFKGLFARMMNWPTKTQVIELYEARLTSLLEAQGLRCEALFPSLSGDPLSSDDTSVRWAELVEAGFPYLKTRVIAKHADDARIKSWLET